MEEIVNIQIGHTIMGGHQDFIPFEQRYEWVPEIRYDKK